MERHFVGRISFPHPLAESPGPSLLFESTLDAGKRSDFQKLKEQFRGLEYRCTNIKCREPVDISQFECEVCNKPLEIKVDIVAEQDGSYKIVPATARAWCQNGHKYTQGKNFPGRCPHDGAELEYCLIGNEKTEFALWMCLAISNKEIGKTTPYYQTFLSLGHAERALDILANAGMLEKKPLDVIIGNYCKEPHYFVITDKGMEKRQEYMDILQKHDLLNDFRIFLPKRESELNSIQENPVGKQKRYRSVLSSVTIKNIPEEIKNSLIEELKCKRGFKKHLAEHIKSDMLYPNEINWLEDIWSKQVPGVYARQNGVIYAFEITPRRKTGDKIVVEHIPSSYQKEIFRADKNKIDWHKYGG